MLSIGTVEMWLMTVCILCSFVGWGYEYYRRKEAELEAENTEMKPHAILGKAITTANTSILIGDFAKILRQNGVNIGAKRLFQWLREHGYLIRRKGSDWNMPTQKSMELKLFEIKESVHIDGNGCNIISRTPKITGRGAVVFR